MDACDFRQCHNTEAIRDLRQDMADVEERLRNVERTETRIDTVLKRIEGMVADQSGRIRKLETQIAVWSGGLALLCFVLGLLVKAWF